MARRFRGRYKCSVRRPHPPGEGWDCTSSLDDEGMCVGRGGGGLEGARGEGVHLR